MRKFKIFTTIFILYEFIAITILHVPEFCFVLFNYNFCETGYKYFLFCIMLPVLIWIMYWWLPKKETSQKTFVEIMTDVVPPLYIKRFLIAVVIVGLRKFIMSHPHARDFLNNVNNILKKTSKQK